MRYFDFSSWQSLLATVLGLALFALIGIGIRLLIMFTIQQRRERMNRQINERLRTLIAAYKVLGGSFTGDLTVDPTHMRDRRRLSEPTTENGTPAAMDSTCGKCSGVRPSAAHSRFGRGGSVGHYFARHRRAGPVGGTRRARTGCWTTCTHRTNSSSRCAISFAMRSIWIRSRPILRSPCRVPRGHQVLVGAAGVSVEMRMSDKARVEEAVAAVVPVLVLALVSH